MRILRSKKGIVTLACTAVAAAAICGTALSGLISQTIIRDSTNVHLRVVRSIAEGYDSGWHTHPGPAIVQVQEGSFQITQGTCTPVTVSAGQTFVEVPWLPVRAVAPGRVVWTTTLVGPYEDALLTPTTSPCP
jgi:quercetin dioxygenase-like cupin family protein